MVERGGGLVDGAVEGGEQVWKASLKGKRKEWRAGGRCGGLVEGVERWKQLCSLVSHESLIQICTLVGIALFKVFMKQLCLFQSRFT